MEYVSIVSYNPRYRDAVAGRCLSRFKSSSASHRVAVAAVVVADSRSVGVAVVVVHVVVEVLSDESPTST